MASMIGIIGRHGLRIEAYVIETNLLTVSFCCVSCSFHFNSYLKQLYISDKTEHLSYKSGCGVTCIEVFERSTSLGYRQIASAY